jgi:hypothetical protein
MSPTLGVPLVIAAVTVVAFATVFLIWDWHEIRQMGLRGYLRSWRKDA